jgi:hypothetical protein
MAWDIGGDVIEDLEFSGPALGVVKIPRVYFWT